MKFAVVLCLCLAATAIATPLSAKLRARRQATSTSTAAPGCPNSSNTGLAGVLEQVGNLLGNILDNLLRLRILNGNGNVMTLLSDLVKQIQKLLTDLLGGQSTLSDDDVNKRQGLLETLLQDVVALLNNLLGTNEATSWTCTPSNGILGTTLTTVLGTLGGLTGSWTGGDAGLLSGLLRVVLQLVGGLLRVLL